MIAKEIRQVVRMTSANMDPAMMFRQRYGSEVCKVLQSGIRSNIFKIIIFVIFYHLSLLYAVQSALYNLRVIIYYSNL